MSETAYTKDDVRVIRELYKQFVEAFASAPQSLLEEALPSAEMALAAEDRGWIRLSDIATTNEFTATVREEIVRRARVYAQFDPLSKQAVRLWTTYAFGRGLTFKSEAEKDQKTLNSFWKYRLNRRIFRADGQHTSSRKLLVDGEVFFAIFTNGPGRPPVVRRLNPLEITNIYSDPDDAERPIFYERLVDRSPSADRLIATQTSPATLYYADFQNFYSSEDIPRVRDSNQAVVNGREQPNVWILHLALDPTTLRGHSLLEPIVDWTRNHNKFMESRVAVMLSLAQFTRRLRATGSAPAFGAIKDQFRTGWTPEGGETSNPPIPAGSTWMEKEGLTLEQMPPETMAANARNDGDMLKLMVCAGTGIMLHYFGDPKCYAIDTEVLSDHGWIAHTDWEPGIKIAAFNPQQETIEFVHPDELHVYDYCGDMVHFENAQTDICVTPNHRMWTAPQVSWKLLPAIVGERIGGRRRIADGGPVMRDRSWQFQEAKEILEHPGSHGWRFKAAAPYHAYDVAYLDTPMGCRDAKTWARFLGYWISEGSTLYRRNGQRQDYRIQLAQNEGVIADRMRDTLTQLDLNWHETENQGGTKMLSFNKKVLWEWLREQCGTDSHTKRIPQSLLLAGDGIRQELFLSLMEGDGGATGACFRYSSVSKELADNVQQLALSLGYGAAVTVEFRNYKDIPRPIWRVWIRQEWMETKIKPHHVSIEHYEGKVCCFHLRHHVYVTRRNGKVAIQGNTGNLATSVAMELPMLKQFETYQQLWSEAYTDLLQFVLDVSRGTPPEEDEETPKIDVDFPPIVQTDISVLAAAFEKFVASIPALAEDEDVRQQVLMALNVEDVETALKNIDKIGKEIERKRQEEPMIPTQPPPVQTGGSPRAV